MEPERKKVTERLTELAKDLGLRVDRVTREGTERNTAGIETVDLLFSRRLDSRTYFVQDQRFGVGREAGVFEGSDDELFEIARAVMDRLEIPPSEIAKQSVVTEQTRVGQIDQEKGSITLEDVQEGKRLALLARELEGVPVWSSNLVLGLTKERRVGFMQLHWPEVPQDVVARAGKLRSVVEQGWRPPEQPGAAVESVEAGIIHSPALGFAMDIHPAIRVVYETLDKTYGRKLTLYLDADGKEVPIPRQFDEIKEEPVQVRPEARPQVDLERARGQFRALLVANPNYFGTFPDSGLQAEFPVQLDTFYEEIGCVGYEPQMRRLEAVVYIKKESGYGGGICSNGTPEYVRFYLSFDDGANWQDQGMASFSAFDIPGKKPLEYDVTLQIDPPQNFCTTENLPLVRAILSWNNPPSPNDPGFNPIWGDVEEARIQIAPLKIFVLDDLFETVKFKLPDAFQQVVDVAQPMPVAKTTALSISELHELYKDTDVEGHRYLFPEVQKLVTKPQLSLAPAAVPGFGGAFAKLNVDLSALIAKLFQTDGDTTYEELRCVGLNPDQSALVGVLTVKLSSGYSGGLCSAGSQEYVGFWIDYGAGWDHLGTTSVAVHDLSGIPSEGLQYAVFLPVDLSVHQQPCEKGPVTARVRAILSWQSPPPPGDPDFVPTWGNREETTIHIKPGNVVDGQVPFLSSAGDIPEVSIGANGKANGTTIHTGFVASDSPFGGVITLAGHISNATTGLKYRIVRKPHGAPDTDYVPLTNEPAGLAIIVNSWDSVNGWVQTATTVHADVLGYYPFEDYSSNHSVEGSIIGRWFSTVGEDGLTFDVRIDLSTDGNPLNDVHSNVVTVLIDNTDPYAELDIDLGAGVQCADFDLGVTFTGTYTATDEHFRTFSFELLPSGPPNDPPHGVLPAPPSGTSVFYGGAISDPGVAAGTYTLNTGVNPGPPQTGPMDACGYALVLHVWDRTNVNSGGGNNYGKASVGFCLRGPEH